MKLVQTLIVAILLVTPPAIAQAQVAGSTLEGVTTTEIRNIAAGWSVRRTVLGHEVYNDQNQKVGTIEDIIITPEKAISYGIVNDSGFLGIRRHLVAMPIASFKLQNGKLTLPGATRESLRAMPVFEYAK